MNLKEQLREKGITYNDILKVYGDPKMTKPLLTACFNGTVGFPKKLYRIILRMLGVSTRDFIGDDAESDESGVITPDYELLNLLGVGKKNAVSRYDLTAVSYTHLRAHETGRNLVCRLLLEKKKYPVSYTHLRADETGRKL